MILIISHPSDIHSLVVAKRLHTIGEDVCILNSADFPQKCSFNWHANNSFKSFELVYHDYVIKSSQIKGVWLRRLKPFIISEDIIDKTVQSFVYNECRDFFIGWLNTFDNIINSHHNEFMALRKLSQLYIAQSIGIKIPETLISNNPEEIKNFYLNRKGEIIFKVLTSTAFQFAGAQLLLEDYLKNINAATISPCIFQERIKVKKNLRITIVDNNIFAASIEVKKEHAKIDWRLESAPVIKPYELPNEVCDNLLKLQNKLGLRYGAIDMILNENNEYVFLENNPAGQFLFIEIHAGLPISREIANSLSNRLHLNKELLVEKFNNQ